MFPTVKWLFFDVGSTLVDEQLCYVLRLQEIASLANLPYELIWKLPCSFTGKIKRETRGPRSDSASKCLPGTRKWSGCTLTPDRA